MPTRDLRGREVPAGKVHRRLAYDALADDGSPEWMERVGDATERATSIAEGRGDLAITVDGVGGYQFPAVDPAAFREVRVGVAFRDGLSERNVVALGFEDADGSAPDATATDAIRYEDASVPAMDVNGRVVRVRDGERTTVERFGTVVGALTDPEADFAPPAEGNATAWVEARMRPAERGFTVVFGGAGRGDAAYEADDEPYGVRSPMRPIFRIDTTPAGTTDTVDVSKAWFEVLHN